MPVIPGIRDYPIPLLIDPRPHGVNVFTTFFDMHHHDPRLVLQPERRLQGVYGGSDLSLGQGGMRLRTD
jgi:hypothetical protein